MNKKKRNCPLCKAAANQQSIKNNQVWGGTRNQKFWQCSKCDAIYLYPGTSQEEDNKFYKTKFSKEMIKRSNNDTWTDPAIQFSKLKKRELPLRLPWFKKLAKPGQRIIEIGSSSGFVLKVLKDWGCDCIGIEVNKPHADYACSLGIRTYADWDELAKAEDSSCDLLLHYYVLEHVIEPLEFLRECLSHVRPGGKMMFEVPNGNDPLTSLYKISAFDKFYWWRAHHWYFTPKSMAYLLKKLGRRYEIYPGQRYDLSNHIHWMLTGKPGGMDKYRHVFSAETEKSYAEDLKRSWLCDYMIVIVY